MPIETKHIQLRQVDLTVFYGTHDANLKLLEKHFQSRFVARGDTLSLEGEPEELARVEDVVTELVFLAQRNKRLSTNDVATVIRLAKAGNGTSAAQGGGDREQLQKVIVYTSGGHIAPRTAGQERYFTATRNSDIVFAIGPAGTGKTFLAVAVAIAALKEKAIKKIILARPAVEAGESLGFLPGDLRDKVDPYLRPLYDALYAMLPRESVRSYLERQVIEIVPLAYMRGRTLDNATLILDEAQNATVLQMKMFLTRMGADSRAIITGDITQIDLPDPQQSGLVQIQRVLQGVDGIAFVYLDQSDVVRHRLVRDIINAYESHARSANRQPQSPDTTGGKRTSKT